MYDLSIDTLDMHAHQEFHRFSNFNLKYNPVSGPSLQEIFPTTDNYTKGYDLAELTEDNAAMLWRVNHDMSQGDDGSRV